MVCGLHKRWGGKKVCGGERKGKCVIWELQGSTRHYELGDIYFSNHKKLGRSKLSRKPLRVLWLMPNPN